eukprot:326218-Lingulodinium_polyedra.AAC.1
MCIRDSHKIVHESWRKDTALVLRVMHSKQLRNRVGFQGATQSGRLRSTARSQGRSTGRSQGTGPTATRAR